MLVHERCVEGFGRECVHLLVRPHEHRISNLVARLGEVVGKFCVVTLYTAQRTEGCVLLVDCMVLLCKVLRPCVLFTVQQHQFLLTHAAPGFVQLLARYGFRHYIACCFLLLMQHTINFHDCDVTASLTARFKLQHYIHLGFLSPRAGLCA
uniref:Uncharacterized protein n=1 Tax=Lygus hesperus TaxID=30085 RepID=A0A146KXK0_LYGHE